MKEWHTLSTEAVVEELNSNIQTGLSETAVNERLQQYGFNELREGGGKKPLRILWEQIRSTMVLILIASAVVSGILGKQTETAAISAIVILFAVLGFVQEYRAEQAMAALKKLTVPIVRVRRNGKVAEISARDLTPGDVVLLESGSAIPADVRFVEIANLRVQEAALTGESEPVDKYTYPLTKADAPLGDRRNMGYMGTTVTYGRGTAVVVATGMNSELGRIARLIQDVEQQLTPLQKNLDQVGKTLAGYGVLVAILVMAIGILRGETVSEMFLTAVSVAVAVVPEGLPAVVTITLALGAQRMLRRRALIRQLPAVETLGSVTVICSDKTGTLTENRMTVTVIDVAGHVLELAGTGIHPALQLLRDQSNFLESQPPTVSMVLAGGALCNDASLLPDPDTGRYAAVGDPTEGALLVAASQAGFKVEPLKATLPRVAELPFDSERKRMTTVHELPAQRPSLLQIVSAITTPYMAITKGSVDGLLDVCTEVWVDDHSEPLTDYWRERIQLANDRMAENGVRVLGLAFKGQDKPRAVEEDLTFIGLMGMIDPPRPEVKDAVATCQVAGIRPIMITGDHPLTARFIAYDLGISTNGRVKTGQDLATMSAADLEVVVEDVSIYARVSPEHKLRIVEALQNKGHIVAMTGDGVNDSPALKKANIGIAMGITGTDVAKEAAQMVLLDDNFATIVAAVEEGRVIFDNIRRFVKFSIGGNLGKVIVMLLAPFLGITIALLPLQLLWLNLLTDGLLGLGLGVEPAEQDTMKQPARSPQASFFDSSISRHIVWVGLLIGVLTLALGALSYDAANPSDKGWQTIMFTTLAFAQIGQALASRSSRASLFKLGLTSNPTLLALAIITFGLQLVAVYVPFLDEFFEVQPLTAVQLLICFLAGLFVFAAIETEKWLQRHPLKAIFASSRVETTDKP